MRPWYCCPVRRRGLTSGCLFLCAGVPLLSWAQVLHQLLSVLADNLGDYAVYMADKGAQVFSAKPDANIKLNNTNSTATLLGTLAHNRATFATACRQRRKAWGCS